MADQKISALTAATTPLAGTEVVPLVQSGTTKKVAVSDLTAGRSVSMLSANISSGAAFSNTRLSVGNNTGAPTGWGIVSVENCGGIAPPSNVGLSVGWNYSNGGGENNLVYGTSAGGDPRLRISSWNGSALTDTLDLMANSNVRVSTQNLVFGSAAKGVNFTANTPAAGMTSQLLNWYEEGTWTPVLSDGTNNATMATAAAAYTRVGNLVTVWAWIETSSLGSVTGNISITGLPFTVKNDNAAYGSAGVVANAYNLNITAGQMVTVRANPNATTLNVYLWDATTGSTNMQASEWSADGGAQFSCSYRAA